METVIEGKYKLVAIIARGGFGETYEAVNLKTGQSVAVKFEKITSKHQQLFLESKIYSLLLSGVDITDQGVPQVHYTGTAGDYNVMVMDLLGPSLEKQLKYCQGTFTIKTVLMLGDQMLKRLEMIHSKNLLHRDVKPENFLLGRADRKKKLYVIDFGLAKRYQI